VAASYVTPEDYSCPCSSTDHVPLRRESNRANVPIPGAIGPARRLRPGLRRARAAGTLAALADAGLADVLSIDTALPAHGARREGYRRSGGKGTVFRRLVAQAGPQPELGGRHRIYSAKKARTRCQESEAATGS
jgi:hypothetical protein